MQGQVTSSDHATGYSDLPITCNTELIGHFGSSGGFKVERYVDAAGHECAYYDGTLIFPIDVPGTIGTYVLDMSDPSNPTPTASLVTPAMLTPHESLLVNTQRGLLAAVMGNPAVFPGIVDVYDISADCRTPVLKSSLPVGILGHESGFAPDGNTFYAASLFNGSIVAVDVSNPSLTTPVWIGNFSSHGLSLNADGTRAYLAARTGLGPSGDRPGLMILDVTQVQQRVSNPQVEVVGTVMWDDGSIPQNAMPVTINGHPYVVEIDEFAGTPIPSADPSAPVGAARIIDIGDETNPKVISNIKLEVHLPENRAAVLGDPGANSIIGYAGHYCGVPREVDPGIVACSMILSGLRVFDIRDPYNPREVAYFNPVGSPELGDPAANSTAMSRPAFAPERNEIWYADGFSGFYVLRLTNGVSASAPPLDLAAVAAPAESSQAVADTRGPTLPASGPTVPIGVVVGLLTLGLIIRWVRAHA